MCPHPRQPILHEKRKAVSTSEEKRAVLIKSVRIGGKPKLMNHLNSPRFVEYVAGLDGGPKVPEQEAVDRIVAATRGKRLVERTTTPLCRSSVEVR